MEERHKFQTRQQTWIQLCAGDFQSHGGYEKQGLGREKKW